MTSKCRLIASLLASLWMSDAKVEFTHSTLFASRDFWGVDEVPLPRCDSGCLIFTATAWDYQPSDDGMEPYMKNLLVNDPVPGKYSILNLNAPDAKGTELTVWIIERKIALAIDYEIYDAVWMERVPAVPKSVVTFMSADQFRVVAQPGEANSYTARLVGFDNAFDGNNDQCTYAYKTPASNSPFDGFELHVDGPLLSVVFDKQNKVYFNADYRYTVAGNRNMAQPGFISSSGYTACEKLGGDQIHRGIYYHRSDYIDLQGKPDFYRVDFDAYLDLKPESQINITDMVTFEKQYLSGTKVNKHVTVASTQVLEISYMYIETPQCFLIRHTPTKVKSAPTTASSSSLATSPAVTTAALTTSSKQTTTTSAAGGTAALAAAAMAMIFQLAR